MTQMIFSKLKASPIFLLAVLILFLAPKGDLYCQNSTLIKDSTASVVPSIGISEISGEFITLSNRLIRISNIIQPDNKILNNDDVVKEYFFLLEEV